MIRIVEGFDAFSSAAVSSSNFWTGIGANSFGFPNAYGGSISTTAFFGSGKSYAPPSVAGAFNIGHPHFDLSWVANTTLAFVGFSYQLSGLSNNTYTGVAMFAPSSATSTDAFSVRVNSNLGLEICNASSGTPLAASANAIIQQGVFQQIEIEFKINTSGNDTISVYVDNVLAVTYTGVVTGTLPAVCVPGLAHASSGFIGVGNTGASALIDDFYAGDESGSNRTTRLGNWRIDTFQPTSEDTNTNVTYNPSTFAAARVNSNDLDTTYGQATNVGDGCIYDSTGTLSASTPGPIYAVAVTQVSRRSDTVTRKVCCLIKEAGGTVTEGEQYPLFSTYAAFSRVWEKRPSDSATLTKTEIEAMRFGWRIKV